VEAILRDENSILTTSSLFTGEYGIDGVYMGIPSVIGSSGIKKTIEIPLNEDEKNSLIHSADTLKDIIKN
jgi:L-lactate dehydrogenase